MALLAVGISSSAPSLSKSLGFLANIDEEKNLSFYYRSGVFCNIPQYAHLVKKDAEYIWKFRTRIGVHKDYPIFLYLLKLIRFSDTDLQLSFQAEDVVQMVLGDWDQDQCWYGKTSITSMALSLLYDMDFPDHDKIVSRCIDFLCSRFVTLGETSGKFSEFLVEDLFLIFNLYERGIFERDDAVELERLCGYASNHVMSLMNGRGFVDAPPVFGGNIDTRIYPTAVWIRAMLAFHSYTKREFGTTFAPALMDAIAGGKTSAANRAAALTPFWGPLLIQNQPRCFILMPFEQDLTEIYERYVKKPIEDECGLACMRSDDMYRPHEIMKDIWYQINVSELIVADMTRRNPNVFYELGLAHAIGKKVILISQKLNDVPFDLRGVRTIIYRNSPGGFEKLAEQLVRAVRETVPSPLRP